MGIPVPAAMGSAMTQNSVLVKGRDEVPSDEVKEEAPGVVSKNDVSAGKQDSK